MSQFLVTRILHSATMYTHLGTPDAGAVIEEGASLSNLVDVVDVPDIETVVVVDARQFVVTFVQTHGDRVRE